MSGTTRLGGRRALITGGAGGLGLEMAERFSEEGARVAICDLDSAALAAVAERHPQWLCMRADVSSEDDVAALFAQVRSSFSGLDILVNNAGIAGPTAPIEAIETSVWQSVYGTNVLGAFLCTRQAVPLLKVQGGSIVIISSAAGRFGVPFRTPYASAKWALVGLAKSLASELGPAKIRVNAILPGLTRGARLDSVIAARARQFGRSFEEQAAVELRSTAMGVAADPVDIANAALYLVSDEGRMVSGIALAVDAGLESASFR